MTSGVPRRCVAVGTFSPISSIRRRPPVWPSSTAWRQPPSTSSGTTRPESPGEGIQSTPHAGFDEGGARTSTPPAALATRLVEAFGHGEDIRRPLGIAHDYPPDHVAAALDYHVKTRVKRGGGKELARGWRRVDTDAALADGNRPAVHGPAFPSCSPSRSSR